MFESPYKGMFDCIRKTMHSEGIGAFYRSYFTQVSMNIPFQCTHLLTYDYIQSIMNPDREYNPISHSISGAIAGAAAAAFTTPLDVCKTLINTQECCDASHPCPQKAAQIKLIQIEKNLPIRATNLKEAMRIIYHTQGYKGFYKGILPRTVFQIPGTAVSWSVYEFFKYTLKNRRPENNNSSSLTV
jgi:solute carrier family 25 iron transporter 28/37